MTEKETVWSTTARKYEGSAGSPTGALDVHERHYPAGTVIAEHSHARHQLLYAKSGLMVVTSPRGRWVVPSTRAIWMPAGTPHGSRCVDDVHQRNIYVSPDVATELPQEVVAVEISPLLRELMQAAQVIIQPYQEDSRDGRVMRLILDELRALPVLPLHVPIPADPRIADICGDIFAHPYDNTLLKEWSRKKGIHPKTLQRLFHRDAGMTFGRWRQRARLLFALERLAQGVPVIEVALELGYESPSAFSAMFKRQFGLTPKKFF